ncbi:MAG: biotin/lipoyl-binding protein [Bacteroidota bacterium]|nr:biotin/lipoyl-binding protein [Bacteroidota bacterium]MDP4204450.1 biotin/lipoyl-binding protein [Bacteroidota bacterium]
MDRVIEKKKGLKKKHLLYILGVIFLLFLCYLIFFRKNYSVLKVESDQITTESVVRGQFNDYIRVIGNVAPITTIYLDAIESGRVEKRLIEEGSMVKKGDIILVLSNPSLNLEILQTEAQVAYYENELRNTQITMEKEKLTIQQEKLQLDLEVGRAKRKSEQSSKLFKENLISREEYLQALEDYDFKKKDRELVLERQKQDNLYRKVQMTSLNERLANMRESLILAREKLESLKVKAPVDGQLGMLNAEIGQSISQGSRIGQINVLSNFKIEARIDEIYIDRTRPGLDAAIDRDDRKFPLHVKKVYPDVRDGQFKTDLVFSGIRPDNIRIGQTYHIDLELGQPAWAVMVPRGGFFQNTGGQWIYVLDPSGKYALKRPIKIGRQNPQFYEVTEGLKPGEKVITSGYDSFGDNEKLILN